MSLEPNISEYNLLLIDDDEVDVMTFQRALKSTDLSYKLTVCYNANEALEKAKKIERSVIMNAMMVKMSV